MQVYLIHAYADTEGGEAKFDDVTNLDRFISANSPKEAVSLWRAYLVQAGTLEPEEAATIQPLSIVIPPHGASVERVG